MFADDMSKGVGGGVEGGGVGVRVLAAYPVILLSYCDMVND